MTVLPNARAVSCEAPLAGSLSRRLRTRIKQTN